MSTSENVTLNVREVIEIIQRIERLDLRTTDIDTIFQILAPLYVDGYSIEVPEFYPGLELYRGRKFTGDEKPELLSEISYPPAHRTGDMRASRAGQSMFYCAVAHNVVIFELKPEVGDRIVWSRWKTTEKMGVNKIGYTSENFNALGSKRLPPPFTKARTSEPSVLDLIQEYFAKEFSRSVAVGDEHLFKVSIALAERHLSADFIHGLMYPTIAMKANAENFAIKPSFVDKYLTFCRAEYIEITKVEGFAYEWNTLDTASSASPDGRIQWNGHGLTWTIKGEVGQKFILKTENGRPVMYDDKGNRIEPD